MKGVERQIRLFLASTILAGTMGACKPGPTTNPDVTSSPTPITSPLPDGMTATIEAPPTQSFITETPTLVPTETATPTYHVEATGGAYSAAQETLNNSPSAQEQRDRIQRWLDYWVNFENRPFAPEAAEISWKYVYDDPSNPTKVVVMIEVGGDYKNRIFTTPIGGDGFAEFPPEVHGDNIAEGFGPLELTAGKQGQWLSVDDSGILVRRDGNRIVERLNMKTRKWEMVGIDMEKFNNFPESYEYLIAHPDEFVQAPDPISDRAAFDRWYIEQLVPALGPLSERELTYKTPNADDATFGFDATSFEFVPPSRMPQIFYFINGGVVYPAVVFNVTNRSYPDETKMTMVVFLHDYVPEVPGTISLGLIKEGYPLFSAMIIYKTDGFFKDVNFGKSKEYIDLFGNGADDVNAIRVGWGFAEFRKK